MLLTVNLNDVSIIVTNIREDETPVGFHMDLNREMWHWFSPWYLNGENGRGGQRFDPWCFHCYNAGMAPFAKQASKEHHKHHKRHAHGGNVFFQDLSI